MHPVSVKQNKIIDIKRKTTSCRINGPPRHVFI
jgi:hypothetical protein